MGNELTEITKKQIRAKIICGAANNQLSNPQIGEWLYKKRILYIPDYVANAGGLINVVDEMESGGYNKVRVNRRIRNIKITVADLIKTSKKKKISTTRIADDAAEKMFRKQ